MELPRSSALVARLEVVPEAGSTNTDLVRAAVAAPEAWPSPSVLATDHQTAGRGRLGRSWSAPAGASLAVSVLLRPRVPVERLAWLSLAAGAAMAQALAGLGVAARAKWPNDVLIDGRKVCGVLAEALPSGAGVVIGAGLNHALSRDDLPVPTATSLVLEGGPTDADLLVAAYLERLLALTGAFEAAGGDPEASGLRAAVLAISDTVGRRVRVSTGGDPVVGEAVDVDLDGRIVVDRGPVLGFTACASGDVEHLRYE
ncbi:biotin--[acetyl-CoA-carboxylase] ligase [Amnibacterium kyonggiense]|uniref:biotin--[biotin carboxyl-carrier protein] ligase n=1 Tax=Amnibacterium kyonggiense TaxID=595671 RepID=A0A4V3EAA8_9MICO|nr:biotin--[acetyl-CoA-carboxylase] ligase [Amnibacterium kyonggiense]TDS74994.1 BirA family biotin operon repressor/biotin-[acetyl-CoA-carboxylase] ligase [Amnibacterium kyonggiense]